MHLDEIGRLAEQLARDVMTPRSAQVDREGRWPAENLAALRRAGLGGLVVPTSAGGLGHGLLALTRVCEAIGAACASTAMCYGMHSVAAAVIAAKATEEQAERLLVPIARGERLTTLALSEPGTGANFYLPECTFERVEGQLVGRGTKTFVTNGGHADSYVLSVRAADADAPGEFSCLVVEGDREGLTWGPEWSGWGMRGNSSRTLELRGARVPAGNLLGTEGDEIWYVFNVIAPFFIVAMSATYLGVARRALDELRAHILARRHAHSGAALSQLTIVQHRVGGLWATLERTRRLLYHAATLGDGGAPDALPALCSAKAEAAECAVTIANEAMSLMGGAAYRDGGPVERCLRDARAAHVMAPTTDMLRIWTGRAVLDQPILGE